MPNWQTNGNAAGPGDFLGTTNAQPLVLQTNGAERARIKDDGTVGIGLNNPRTQLHVQGAISSGFDNVAAGTVTLFPPDGFAWFHIDNGPGGRPIGRLRISHGATPGASELMTLVQDGNVGIGLAAPAVKLHVAGNRVRLEQGGRKLDLRADGSAVDVQSETHDLYIRASGPRGRNNVIINPFGGVDGNVAIGMTAPTVKLHVVGNRVRLEQGGKKLDLRADGSAVDVQSETHDLYIRASGPRGRNNVIINPFGGDGNVAIGLTTPSDKLHVQGNVRANDFIVTSDAALKADIVPLQGALDKLRRMRGVEFAWKPESGGRGPAPPRRRPGVIAQEVEAVAPELVHRIADGPGHRGVNMGGMLATLIEGLKELAASNDALCRRIDALERGHPGSAAGPAVQKP